MEQAKQIVEEESALNWFIGQNADSERVFREFEEAFAQRPDYIREPGHRIDGMGWHKFAETPTGVLRLFVSVERSPVKGHATFVLASAAGEDDDWYGYLRADNPQIAIRSQDALLSARDPDHLKELAEAQGYEVEEPG